MLQTAQNSILFVTFKDGELHGPAYGHGQVPIYADDYQVCIYLFDILGFNHEHLTVRHVIVTHHLWEEKWWEPFPRSLLLESSGMSHCYPNTSRVGSCASVLEA